MCREKMVTSETKWKINWPQFIIGLAESLIADTSQALCALVTAETGIGAERIYIEFTDAPRSMWGWNGGTFG